MSAPGRQATGNPLRVLTRILTEPGEYERAVDAAAAWLAETLRAAALVALVTPDGRHMHGIALHHYRPGTEHLLESVLGEPFDVPPMAAQALETGETIRVVRAAPEQLAAAPPGYQPFFEAIQASSFVAAPLRAPRRRLGILTMARSIDEEPFAPADADVVESAASLIALRAEHGYLLEELEPCEPPVALEEVLTGRESEILGLLARGHTNREIAEQLVLSVRTVEWHRARIQWKLGVQSRAELFQMASALGLA